MKPIRAWHMSVVKYWNIFAEIVGLSLKEKSDLYRKAAPGKTFPGFDCTDYLTAQREYLAKHGYANEVELTDKRFLAEHHGWRSDEAWEDFWARACESRGIDPRKDAL